MQVYFKEFVYSTNEHLELVDITEQVTAFVRECNIESGISLVNSPHSTTAIIVNEHESGLMKDSLQFSRPLQNLPHKKRKALQRNMAKHLSIRIRWTKNTPHYMSSYGKITSIHRLSCNPEDTLTQAKEYSSSFFRVNIKIRFFSTLNIFLKKRRGLRVMSPAGMGFESHSPYH